MVVWLASFPRSGNTFFRIALEKLYGLHSLSVYEDDPASISRQPSIQTRKGLEGLRSSEDVYFIKTHELPEDDSPAILLVRDGRDAMVSLAHFIEDYGMVRRAGIEAFLARLDDCKQRWLYGRSPFDQLLRRVIAGEYFNWSEHYRAWSERRARCSVLKFETLIRERELSVERSLASLGISLSRCEDSLPAFETLHAQDPKFYRAGVAGQWRTEMSPDTEEFFWREHGETMVSAGYER